MRARQNLVSLRACSEGLPRGLSCVLRTLAAPLRTVGARAWGWPLRASLPHVDQGRSAYFGLSDTGRQAPGAVGDRNGAGARRRSRRADCRACPLSAIASRPEYPRKVRRETNNLRRFCEPAFRGIPRKKVLRLKCAVFRASTGAGALMSACIVRQPRNATMKQFLIKYRRKNGSE